VRAVALLAASTLLVTGCSTADHVKDRSKGAVADASFVACARSASLPTGSPSSWSGDGVRTFVQQPALLKCALKLPDDVRDDLLHQTLGRLPVNDALSAIASYIASVSPGTTPVVRTIGILASAVDDDPQLTVDEQNTLLAFWSYQSQGGTPPGYAAWQQRHASQPSLAVILSYVEVRLPRAPKGSDQAKALNEIRMLRARIAAARG
jgi:hypothetical protein